jgi:hypothetical protein
MRVNGTCHCGRITFEADVEPDTVVLCHCTDCQMLTGSAYRAIIRALGDSFVLRGEPTTYVKTADSGNKREHAFCPTCGTPIYSAPTAEPKTYSLRVGTLSERAQLRPRVQGWCRSALPWSMDLGGIEQRDGQ